MIENVLTMFFFVPLTIGVVTFLGVTVWERHQQFVTSHAQAKASNSCRRRQERSMLQRWPGGWLASRLEKK